jgi:hypothetical protein
MRHKRSRGEVERFRRVFSQETERTMKKPPGSQLKKISRGMGSDRR